MRKINIEPRGKYVLVRPDESEDRESENGILMPDSVEQEQRSQGEVISVGDGVKGVKKGDKVIYGTYAGETLKLMESAKKVDYKLLHDDDVIAFIR